MVVYNESAHADIENIQVPFLYRNGNGWAHSQSEWAQSVEFLGESPSFANCHSVKVRQRRASVKETTPT